MANSVDNQGSSAGTDAPNNNSELGARARAFSFSVSKSVFRASVLGDSLTSDIEIVDTVTPKEGILKKVTSVKVIDFSDRQSPNDQTEILAKKNKSFLEAEKAVGFYDNIIKYKIEKISKNRQDRIYFQAVKVIGAILVVASVSILIVASTILPFAAIIALIIVSAVSFIAFPLSIIDTADKTGQIKSSEEQILVAKILKEMYSNPSVKNNINPEDIEFRKIHTKIQGLLFGSISAGYIESKELLSVLKNSSASKEDINNCLVTTLMQFICLSEPHIITPQEVVLDKSEGQFFQHIELFLNNSSKEQIASVLLETENNVELPIAEKLDDNNSDSTGTEVVR